ncbi:trimeric intracellular cation channel family protein [Stygiolobus azoricus]|uniref:Trimeric intracellular cation channel family protein n=1 Tax=Stygiolobus azoricus TaxID=41675 RepID=A0A650CNH7_9CREN|nr:trimeric intracellular cation channel family protein [Stygiolobus azoricus]QGR19222.1 trimeric intracellular cation channel family protein [Stygiolobus azoricus]
MNLVLDVTNYIGIVAFSVSGAIKGIKKNMDLLGVLVLGFSTALGGGIIADLLLGKTPPTNLTYLPYPTVALLSSLFTFVFYKIFSHVQKPLLYADAIGLAAFAVSGSSLAYSVSENVLLVVTVGTITATGGGVIRDLLSNEVPMVLTRDFYATVAILGSLIYFSLRQLGYSDLVTTMVSFTITLVIRVMAIRNKWELPKIKV